MLTRLNDIIRGLVRRGWRSGHSSLAKRRGRRTHVIVLDGTMSSLAPGAESHAGMTYKLLSEMNGAVSLYYEAGIQWQDWKSTHHVMMGRGINRQIRRAYGFLASRYRPGDRIFLIGYSRGAYAVRSLAGAIDRVGLVRHDLATTRNIRQAYRYYEHGAETQAARDFAEEFCHRETEIEAIGVWDTVKALGLRLPLLWKGAERRHSFHNHELGRSIRNGFHALALDETREVFDPILWKSHEDWDGRIEQVWFRGAHGDVGGQLGGYEAARPLANIPLVWMLGRLSECGLPLPEGWRDRFDCDAAAPSVGTWRGWGKIFLLRKARAFGRDPSEMLHTSVPHRPVMAAKRIASRRTTAGVAHPPA